MALIDRRASILAEIDGLCLPCFQPLVLKPNFRVEVNRLAPLDTRLDWIEMHLTGFAPCIDRLVARNWGWSQCLTTRQYSSRSNLHLRVRAQAIVTSVFIPAIFSWNIYFAFRELVIFAALARCGQREAGCESVENQSITIVRVSHHLVVTAD